MKLKKKDTNAFEGTKSNPSQNNQENSTSTSIKILSGKLTWINPDKEKAKHSKINPKHLLYLLKCDSKLSVEILEKSWHDLDQPWHDLVILKK